MKIQGGDCNIVSELIRMIDWPADRQLHPTYMSDGHDEGTVAKVLVNAFDVGQDGFGVEAQVCAVKPVDELHRPVIGRGSLIVIHSKDKLPRVGDDDRPQWLLQVPPFDVLWQMMGTPEEHIKTQAMGEVPVMNLEMSCGDKHKHNCRGQATGDSLLSISDLIELCFSISRNRFSITLNGDAMSCELAFGMKLSGLWNTSAVTSSDPARFDLMKLKKFFVWSKMHVCSRSR